MVNLAVNKVSSRVKPPVLLSDILKNCILLNNLTGLKKNNFKNRYLNYTMTSRLNKLLRFFLLLTSIIFLALFTGADTINFYVSNSKNVFYELRSFFLGFKNNLNLTANPQSFLKGKTKLLTLLKIKLFKLKLEKTIFNRWKIKSRVFIENMFRSVGFFNKVGLLPQPSDFPRWIQNFYFFNELLNIFFSSLFLKSSNLLALFVKKNINNNKRHFNFLKRLKLATVKLYEKVRPFFLKGLFIGVWGKFQGYLRKRCFKMVFGSSGMSDFSTSVAYDLKKSYTRWGVFSIKVFFFFGNLISLETHEIVKIKQFYKEVYKKIDIPIRNQTILFKGPLGFLAKEEHSTVR